mgnify:CR=1 FL=1
MTENFSNPERQRERVLSLQEILDQLEILANRPFQIDEVKADKSGPYYVRAWAEDEEGDPMEYSYQRQGNFDDCTSAETVIDVAFYSGGVPCGGHCLAKFINGEWVKEFS